MTQQFQTPADVAKYMVSLIPPGTRTILEPTPGAFLQNPWSRVYAGGRWPRKSWLEAFKRSRSGQRLKIFTDAIGEDKIWYDNTTPIVADNPTTIIPADPQHIKKVLAERRPKLILAFGKQAGIELRKLHGQIPLIILPHPTYRVVTNELFKMACKIVSEYDGKISILGEVLEFKQKKGGIVIITPNKESVFDSCKINYSFQDEAPQFK